MESLKITKQEKINTNCPHNIETRNFCQECLLEAKNNQSIWAKIEELSQNSKGRRDVLQPDCNVKLEGNNFEIHTIRSKEDPALEKVFDLLEKYFKEDELNTRESFIRKMEGLTKDGDKRPAYRCFYVEDENKNVIATRVAENFPLQDKEGKETNENIFYGLYIVIDKEYQSTGLARELYISALIDAAVESQKENKDLTALVAECTPASEKLMNTVGLKKIYFKDENQFKEFEYYQPAIEFDTETGENTTQEVAEHIMVYNTPKKGILNKELFHEILSSLYQQYQNNYKEKAFKTKEAFEKYTNYYNNLKIKTKEDINNQGELVMLSITEQEEQIKNGSEIIHFEKANQR